MADYSASATPMVQSLVSETALRLGMARTLATSVAIRMQSMPNATNTRFDDGTWSRLVREMRLVGLAVQVTYAPLLLGDDQRREFEAFAREQALAIDGDDEEDICYPCGSKYIGYKNLDQTIFVPGYGEFTCKRIQDVLFTGFATSAECPGIIQVTGDCICGEVLAQQDENEMAAPKIYGTIFTVDETNGTIFLEEPYGQEMYSPIWESVVDQVPLMYNQLSREHRRPCFSTLVRDVSPVITMSYLRDSSFEDLYEGFADELAYDLFFPVLLNNQVVGTIGASLIWKHYVTHILPPNSEHLILVVTNTCGQVFSFSIERTGDGKGHLILLGFEDLHDRKFDDMQFASKTEEMQALIDYFTSGTTEVNHTEHCAYKFNVYPSQAYEDIFLSREPTFAAIVVGCMFGLMTVVFVLYDFVVRRRQKKVMASANRTNDIVVDLFPSNVRSRLYEAQQCPDWLMRSKSKMESFLQNDENVVMSEPIADLFPHTVSSLASEEVWPKTYSFTDCYVS